MITDITKNIKYDGSMVSTIKQWQDDVESDVSTWENKQDKWHRLRMRIKKTKNFPFKGCSNIRMPTLETEIRKIKSRIINGVFGIRPVVQVVPTPGGDWEGANRLEKFLDHLIMDVVDLKEKAVVPIDKSCEQGFYLMKPYWKYECIKRRHKLSINDITLEEAIVLFSPTTDEDIALKMLIDRFSIDTHESVEMYNIMAVEEAIEKILGGQAEVDVVTKDVVYNFPDVALVPPERCYVPSTSGYDPQSCRYIIHEFFLNVAEVRQRINSGKWDNLSNEDLDYYLTVDVDDKSLDDIKDMREGISRIKRDGVVKIFEAYYQDDDGNKYICTIAPDFSKELKKIELPFYSGKYPFVKLFYELTDDRWFSHRGLPELIEDIVKEIDIQHMQKIDYGTLSNRPLFMYRAGKVQQGTMQFSFGQGIPVSGMDDLGDIMKPMQFNNPNVNFQYEREQMILETKVQELVGSVDYGLQSMINRRQPRTNDEVNMQAMSTQMTASLDTELYRKQFEKLFNWIAELWFQYGSDEYEFNYFGRGEFESIKVKKEEFQGKYKIKVRANDNNTNPQQQLSKAQAVLQAQNNPVALQMGIVNPMTMFNAYKRFYQELDVEGWEQMVVPPPPPPPPNQRPENQDVVGIRFGDLTDAEKAQVLAQKGIQPDIEGRAMNKSEEVKEKEFQQIMEVAKTEG